MYWNWEPVSTAIGFLLSVLCALFALFTGLFLVGKK